MFKAAITQQPSLHYCRVREYERGYWPVMRYFTRSEAVQTLSHLPRVLTDVGRGGGGEGGGEGGGGWRCVLRCCCCFPPLRPSVAVPGTQRAVYGELCAHVSREPSRRFRALPEVGVNAPFYHMKLILPLIPPLSRDAFLRDSEVGPELSLSLCVCVLMPLLLLFLLLPCALSACCCCRRSCQDWTSSHSTFLL